jgi:hypothetical protein
LGLREITSTPWRKRDEIAIQNEMAADACVRPKGTSRGGSRPSEGGRSRMIRISKTSRLRPEEIVKRASQFFGKGGEGLQETERGACCISFSGAGGHVTVLVSDADNQSSVEVESKEFDYQAKRFLNSL